MNAFLKLFWKVTFKYFLATLYIFANANYAAAASQQLFKVTNANANCEPSILAFDDCEFLLLLQGKLAIAAPGPLKPSSPLPFR